MGAGSFNIEVVGAAFLIKKTRRAFVMDMIWFAVFMLAMAAIFVFLYLYISVKVNPLHIFLFGLLFMFMCILYYRNKIIGAVSSIIKRGNEYWVGNQFAFDVNEKKGLVVYETAGELLADFAGSLYLKVKTSEYPLYTGVTEEELLEIKTQLELYFSEPLELEFKRTAL